jgi:signal transduction histidine kinase
MSERVWYRSLYWRIAVGFVLFLTGVLAVQGAVLLWMLSRGGAAPGPPPRGFTRILAADLSAALEANSHLDLDRYVRDYTQQRGYPFFVLMTDGRMASTGGTTPTPPLLEEARARLDSARVPRPDGPPMEPWRFDPPGAGGPPPGGGRFAPPSDPGGGRFAPPSEIVVGRRVVGVVAAMPQSPLGQLGPMMAILAAGLVVAGTALASLFIAGPVRRRLRGLEEAARRVGAGDLAARAPENGGDEVAALAAVFNRMAADLESRARELQSADQARRLLLADVSHELRTPLTAMRGYLETLSMPELNLDPDARARYVGIVNDETCRLEYIVGDLLDLAILEGGSGTLDLQDVAIEDLFGRVVARHDRDCKAREIALSTWIAPGAEIVTGDPLRLEQALQNLAANAVRHTPDRGRIDLGAEVDGSDIVLSVRDNGPGIPSEHLPLVFERFYKVDPSRKRDTAGSGLGLSIVRAIVLRHGGSVTARNAPERGTIFTIRLPNSGGSENREIG